MHFRVALFSCCLLLQSCSSDKIPVSICSFTYFTLSKTEHIIEEMEKPIIVLNVKGKITNEVGGWPDNTRILFEIRGIGKGAKTIQAQADGEGNFEIPRVAKGNNCFKATVDGWRSVMGILKVSRWADPNKRISIIMIPGV
jgi:hypothetical protein